MSGWIVKLRTLLVRAMVLSGILLFCLFFYKCPFRLIFHINCPGCGMTRAVLAALRLDFRAAWEYHPLYPLALAAGVYYVFRPQIQKKIHLREKYKNAVLFAVCMLFLGRWAAGFIV